MVRLFKKLSHQTDVSGGPSWMVHQIVEQGQRFIRQTEGKIKGGGIGFGGPVDFKSQTIITSHHVKGWNNYPLSVVLSEEFGLPCVVGNDAKVAALGELVFGKRPILNNLVYITISTGIGGGIILNRQIYYGSTGYAGEIGHFPVIDNGPICSCGNHGCLETICSGRAIGKRAQEAVLREPLRGKFLLQTAGGEISKITAKSVFKAVRLGDNLSSVIVEETCRYLGMSIGGLINIFDPDIILIGDGVSKAGSAFFVPLRKEITHHLMFFHKRRFHCVPASLRDNSVLLGAVALALKHC